MYNKLNSSHPPFSDMLWHYERNLVNTISDLVIIIYFDSFDGTERMFRVYVEFNLIRLLRIIFIPSKFCYFRPPEHVISMECKALDFWCECTQQKLQSICAVLTFDPQLKKS